MSNGLVGGCHVFVVKGRERARVDIDVDLNCTVQQPAGNGSSGEWVYNNKERSEERTVVKLGRETKVARNTKDDAYIKYTDALKFRVTSH